MENISSKLYHYEYIDLKLKRFNSWQKYCYLNDCVLKPSSRSQTDKCERFILRKKRKSNFINEKKYTRVL